MITAYSYASAGNEHYVLAPLPTAQGYAVARTKESVLDGVAAWPGNVYELRIDERDVLAQGPYVLQVRAYDVVRVMPREQVFGANVGKLDALFTELRTFGWLRPTSEDRHSLAAVLVAEHYAALGHYLRVRAGRSRIVREIDKLDLHLSTPLPVADRAALAACNRAHTAVVRAVDRRIRQPMRAAVMRIIAGTVLPAAWRAAWEHVAAAHLEYVIAVFREEDFVLDDRGAKLLELIAEALEAASQPGFEEFLALRAIEAGAPFVPEHVDRAVAQAQAVIPSAWRAKVARIDEIVASVVRRVWFFAWRFTTHAALYTGGHAVHVASGLREPDPWAPWVAMLRAGLWPLADDGVHMTIYEPPMNSE